MTYNNIYTYTMSLFTLVSTYMVMADPAEITTPFMIYTCLFYVFATDLVSGLLHIVLDNKRSLEIPVIRPLAEGFQRHHINPKNIYQMSWYKHIFGIHLPLTFLFVVVLIVNSPKLYFSYVSLVLFMHLMQMSHRWSHTPVSMLSKPVILLQKMRILLTRKAHGVHHNGIYDSNFCIFNGYMNPLLNKLTTVFNRESHGWVFVFVISTIAMLICPIWFS